MWSHGDYPNPKVKSLNLSTKYAPIYVTWFVYPICSFAFFASTWVYSFVDDGYYQGCYYLREPIIWSFVMLVLCAATCLLSLRSISKHHAAVISKVVPPEHRQPKSTLYGMKLDISQQEPPNEATWIRRGYQKHWWCLGLWSAATFFYCISTCILRVGVGIYCLS